MKRIWLALGFVVTLASGAAFAQVPRNTGTPGIPISASSGNVAAATATATLAAGGANKITYICGFAATGGGATAAAVVNLAVSGLRRRRPKSAASRPIYSLPAGECREHDDRGVHAIAWHRQYQCFRERLGIPTLMADEKVIGRAHDYEGLLALLRKRFVDLQITFETLDYTSGLQSNYSNKGVSPVRSITISGMCRRHYREQQHRRHRNE
jgi:hypothetical protein